MIPFFIIFPSGQFLLSRIILNPNYELKNQENLHLFSTSPSFRIKDLGFGISTLYPDHQIWNLSSETPLKTS